MTNNIPFNRAARKICIVCEGNEEYEYLKRLICMCGIPFIKSN